MGVGVGCAAAGTDSRAITATTSAMVVRYLLFIVYVQKLGDSWLIRKATTMLADAKMMTPRMVFLATDFPLRTQSSPNGPAIISPATDNPITPSATPPVNARTSNVFRRSNRGWRELGMVQSVVADVLFCAATGVLAAIRATVGGKPLVSSRFKPWCRFEAMQP